MTYFLNFWTPSISRELFELETSNLARRLTNVDANDKNLKKYVKGGLEWNGILGPLRISKKVGARNFNFGMQIEHQGH